MKPSGSHLSYDEQRNKELYAAYKRVRMCFTRENGTIDINAAVTAAAASPCSRYWISEGIARKTIMLVKRNPSLLNSMHASKRLMYQSLIAQFDKMRADPKYADLNDTAVSYLASDSPAPSFFLGLSNAKRLIHAAARAARNKNK